MIFFYYYFKTRTLCARRLCLMCSIYFLLEFFYLFYKVYPKLIYWLLYWKILYILGRLSIRRSFFFFVVDYWHIYKPVHYVNSEAFEIRKKKKEKNKSNSSSNLKRQVFAVRYRLYPVFKNPETMETFRNATLKWISVIATKVMDCI